MSSLELSEEYELRLNTCWVFKWKIQQVMASSKQYSLEGEVHVDEFFVGGEENQKHGREHGKKRLVVVALEIISGKGVGRAYARVIPDASAKLLRLLFKDYISKDAKVITDEWNGYKPLKDGHPLLE